MWRRWTNQRNGWMKRSNLANDHGFAAEPNPSRLNDIGAMLVTLLQDGDVGARAEARWTRYLQNFEAS